MENSKKLKGVGIALIVFLSLRVLGSLILIPMYGQDDDTAIFAFAAFIFACVYGLGIFTTAKRLEWGMIPILIVLGLDTLVGLFVSLMMESGTGVFFVFWNAIIASLAIADNKHIKGGGKTPPTSPAAPTQQ